MKALIFGAVLLECGTILLTSNRIIASNEVPLINKTIFVAANTVNTEELVSRGTEPFWSVTVNKSGIVYSSPEGKKQQFPYVAPLKAAGRPIDLLRVYRLRGRSNSMLIIKKVRACSDGMSDKEYPYSATLILGDTVLEGCAEKK